VIACLCVAVRPSRLSLLGVRCCVVYPYLACVAPKGALTAADTPFAAIDLKALDAAAVVAARHPDRASLRQHKQVKIWAFTGLAESRLRALLTTYIGSRTRSLARAGEADEYGGGGGGQS